MPRKRKTTEEFILEAKEIHENRYDYSKSIYTTNKNKLIIICPIHGEFEQTPSHHLKGAGCRKCNTNKQRKTTEEFIQEARNIHDDRYDYSKVNYIKALQKVIIVCPIHGEFLQKPSEHLQGKGCIKCSGNYLKTTNEFIEDAKAIHNNKYDYTKTNYINAKIKLVITCPNHGDFEQTPNDHLLGHGCYYCGKESTGEALKDDIEAFTYKAISIHGDKFDYSKVRYFKSSEKVEIICPEHGSFWQIPYVHIAGHTCPACAKYGFDKNKLGTLYYLKILTTDNNVLYKIGITNRSVKERFSSTDLSKISILYSTVYKNGEEAYREEQRILNKYKEFKYTGNPVLESGNTELFTKDVLNYDTTKEIK